MSWFGARSQANGQDRREASWGGSRGGYGQDRMAALGSNLGRVNWQSEQLGEFQKNFYQEHPSVSARSEGDVQALRARHNISVMSGHDVPRPVQTFEEAGFPDYVMNEIRRAGFSEPSAIQVQAWPVALSGRDMVGIAQTGSGKTCGFLLP